MITYLVGVLINGNNEAENEGLLEQVLQILADTLPDLDRLYIGAHQQVLITPFTEIHIIVQDETLDEEIADITARIEALNSGYPLVIIREQDYIDGD